MCIHNEPQKYSVQLLGFTSFWHTLNQLKISIASKVLTISSTRNSFCRLFLARFYSPSVNILWAFHICCWRDIVSTLQVLANIIVFLPIYCNSRRFAYWWCPQWARQIRYCHWLRGFSNLLCIGSGQLLVCLYPIQTSVSMIWTEGLSLTKAEVNVSLFSLTWSLSTTLQALT